MSTNSDIPLIDIAAFTTNDEQGMKQTAKQLHDACRKHGFFYVQNHGVEIQLQSELERVTRDFFALDEAEKMKIHMMLGGKAIRGYFPIGGELTSGKPDLKEGIYFGTEDDDIQAGSLAMHGKNLWPEFLPELQPLVVVYMAAMKNLGDKIMRAVALSLELPIHYFEHGVCSDPFQLFRAFQYPSAPNTDSWGVGEHTDYGLLTILRQDHVGGLQIFSENSWINAPVIPNTFICNIGDMLDRMTNGYYRSTRHRVRNSSYENRLTFPFFYDPSFHSEPSVIDRFSDRKDENTDRWDGVDVYQFKGTYGNYISNKVRKVFPELWK